MRFLVPAMLCIAALSSAETTYTYDATYASWLSQSWTTAGGTSQHGTIVSAEQEIEPGLIHRISYRQPSSVGVKPFASVAGAGDSKYVQAVLGLDCRFNETWRLTTEVEYGTFNVSTNMRDEAGNRRHDEAESTYQSALVTLGAESFGGYFVMRKHDVPNVIRFEQDDGRTLDMYYDKDYSSMTVMLGLYTRLSTEVAGGDLTLDLKAAMGQCAWKAGSQAKAQFESDWGYAFPDSHFRGYEFAADLGYERRFSTYGMWGIGVRALGFGTASAFDSGDGNHDGGSQNVNQGISGSPSATRMDAFWGPYIRIGATF